MEKRIIYSNEQEDVAIITIKDNARKDTRILFLSDTQTAEQIRGILYDLSLLNKADNEPLKIEIA